MSRRLKAMGQKKYKNGFKLTLHENTLQQPLAWKSPHDIFVCSMSDLFHEEVPDSFLVKVMETIKLTPQHRYQLLTKRAERMADFFFRYPVPHNVWLGVTVEDQKSKERIDVLRKLAGAPIRFLSCEPLLEDLGKLDLTNIDWVIVGGESGPRARPMQETWVLSIKEQTETQGSTFFFKQWGTWGSDGIKRSKQANGKKLRGKVCQKIPLSTQTMNLAKA